MTCWFREREEAVCAVHTYALMDDLVGDAGKEVQGDDITCLTISPFLCFVYVNHSWYTVSKYVPLMSSATFVSPSRYIFIKQVFYWIWFSTYVHAHSWIVHAPHSVPTYVYLERVLLTCVGICVQSLCFLTISSAVYVCMYICMISESFFAIIL